MTSLLDVNVLIALLDADHVHHLRAKHWLLSQADPAWASCPITQNGFVRITSQAAYPGHVTVSQSVSLLASAASSPHHQFWPDDLSLLDDSIINFAVLHGSKQVTDVYLLALAVKNGGRLVAFDRAITLNSVLGAEPDHLVIL